MHTNFEENLHSDPNLSSEDKISEALRMNLRISCDSDVKDEENGVADNHGVDAEEEFTFMCGGTNASPIAAEDAFVNGQIKPIFPLFNRDLLFDSNALYENLPRRPPVKKVFVEATVEDRQTTTSSTLENYEAAGPYCDWSSRKAVEVSPEVCRKSNSTGFSKIWRFKDFLGRSNSDGRDAFVFLNNSQPAPPSVLAKGEEKNGKKGGTVIVKERKVKKGKPTSLSPHESYLRNKAAKKDNRRRSYLPYRPELMGFFTNINDGLTKNVHPF